MEDPRSGMKKFSDLHGIRDRILYLGSGTKHPGSATLLSPPPHSTVGGAGGGEGVNFLEALKSSLKGQCHEIFAHQFFSLKHPSWGTD
jgi:hypothetical protein